jgi:hypothetical protein
VNPIDATIPTDATLRAYQEHKRFEFYRQVQIARDWKNSKSAPLHKQSKGDGAPRLRARRTLALFCTMAQIWHFSSRVHLHPALKLEIVCSLISPKCRICRDCGIYRIHSEPMVIIALWNFGNLLTSDLKLQSPCSEGHSCR